MKKEKQQMDLFLKGVAVGMSKIKIGEYVRFEEGDILKVDENIVNYVNITIEKIKNSPNIIDLIEIGDYVNGKLIHYILKNPKNGETMICYGNGKHIDNKHIKSIVTKEQFDRMEYKL